VIGFDVGGYDLYARAVARHLTKHIPGNPVFVPQNMPGAGSRGAANWLPVEPDCHGRPGCRRKLGRRQAISKAAVGGG
jgi:hypothetical protein